MPDRQVPVGVRERSWSAFCKMSEASACGELAQANQAMSALSWQELGQLCENVLTNLDYENGPPLSQSRLRLFGQSKENVRVTLFRDYHAWCPYSQRVWMWLEEKRIPYRVEKVSLQCYGKKESWYVNLVPSGKVPAVELDGKHLIEDSLRILAKLEKVFGPLGPSIQDPSCRHLLKLERDLFNLWINWLTAPERSKVTGTVNKKRMVRLLMELDKIIGQSSSDYITGEISTFDTIFYPTLERLNATLYYYRGFTLRHGAFTNIDAWFTAMENRPACKGSLSDCHTTVHVVPALFGVFYESNDEEQKRCKALVDDGPFLISDEAFSREAAEICLARSVKHHSSILKQNPHRHGDSDLAFRCALTYLVTGIKIRPPEGTQQSLRYIRDRCSCPRDMPRESAMLFRHVCESSAAMLGKERSTIIPRQHRFDQEPFAFTQAAQQSDPGHEASTSTIPDAGTCGSASKVAR